MLSLSLVNLSVWYLCTLLIQLSFAIDLEPIRPLKSRSRLGKRYDDSALDLRSEETFFWGANGSSDVVLANFTVSMPGESENILSMEKFDNMLKSVDCGTETMTLGFKDDKTFAYAQRRWDWVNGADNHSFVMVAGKGDCGWNDMRVPFIVSKLSYDEVNNVARLKAKATEWADIAHTYKLHVGHVPDPDSGLQPRGLGGDMSVNIAHDLSPGILKLKEGPMTTGLEVKCATKGSFNFEFDINANPLDLSVVFKVAPKGVSADASVKLSLEGELTKGIGKTWPIASIPLQPYNLPGLGTFGPTLDFDVGVELSNISAAVSITQGYTASISDSAIFQVDLFDTPSRKMSGWKPIIRSTPMSLEGKISASGKPFFFQTGLKLKAEVLKHGYEIGLDLKAPYVDGTLDFIEAVSGLCKDKDGTCSSSPTASCKREHQFGVQVGTKFGGDLEIKAAKIGHEADPLFKVVLAKEETPTWATCFPFGPTVQGGGDSTSSKPPSHTSGTDSSPTAPPDNGSPATCKNNKGLGGECISTSACSKAGGSSEAGHCPGGTDIQCCTYGTCKTKAGVSGNCISTGLCKSKGGTSTPGLCPGDDNVQCCTTDGPKDYGTCEVKGIKGSCIPKNLCQSEGGTSTTGLCPGNANIQCCTYDKPDRAKDSGKCEVKGVAGSCIATEVCKSDGGVSTPGLCPGDANIQCCIHEKPKNDGTCKANGVTGSCMPAQACHADGGVTTAGLCSGGANVQCCTFPK